MPGDSPTMTFVETSYIRCSPFSLIESEGPISFSLGEEPSSGRHAWQFTDAEALSLVSADRFAMKCCGGKKKNSSRDL